MAVPLIEAHLELWSMRWKCIFLRGEKTLNYTPWKFEAIDGMVVGTINFLKNVERNRDGWQKK